MSKFHEDFEKPWNPTEGDKLWADVLQAKYPLLVDAMTGSGPSLRSGAPRPRMSFILSATSGELRFSLSHKDCSRSYSGPILDPSDPLMSAERCLADGSGKWWDKDRK